MSTQESGTAESAATGRASEEDRSEIDRRAAYEAELSRITSADLVLQATVSLLNIGARRLGLVDGGDPSAGQQTSSDRDLEQVRDAIDAVRGLMPVVERRAPQEARPLRDALSQLQMAYARESQTSGQGQGAEQAPAGVPQGGPAAGRPAAGQASQDQPPAASPAGKPAPGPAESSGRLWVPGH